MAFSTASASPPGFTFALISNWPPSSKAETLALTLVAIWSL
jgi:hypothetical protein